MKLRVDIKLNLKLDEARKKTEEAVRLGLRDTVAGMWNDAVQLSPVKTGHNRRSIAAEVSGMGVVQKGEDVEAGERMVDDSKLEAAVYSTSGYGGFLETGTVKMSAQPYVCPAWDMNVDKLVGNIKKHMDREK